MNYARLTLIAAFLVVAACLGYTAHGTQGDKKVDTRVFELRTYYAKPGKMDALNARFRDHTNKLFVKHGMTLIGYWNPIGKESQEKLIYILAHKSEEAAKKSWDAFKADPDWIAAKKASEKDGPLVAKVESVFMNPTDYSPIK